MSLSLRLALGRVTGWYLKVCARTTRWTRHGEAHVRENAETGQGVILAVWHGRLLVSAPMGWPNYAIRPCYALISMSKDGDSIDAAFQVLGLRSVRGSTAKGGKDKGGASALKEMIRLVRAGSTVAVTPDGPRGPRQRVTPGILLLAKATGAPIIPITGAMAGQSFAAKSWDLAAIPAPFSAGHFYWGAPIHVARDADDDALEAARQKLEIALNTLTAEADAAVGKITPEPAASPITPAAENPA